MLLILFLSSGLFLGWSLGANDAANVFGTAVGSKMVKFRTAAIITSIFVLLGAYISGSGASHTLGELGSINEIAGAFVVCLAAAASLYIMTKINLPVSSSQAIVGAIIGWNLFSGFLTDFSILNKILSTWILCPLLSAVFSFLIYRLSALIFNNIRIHMLILDFWYRAGLIIVGALGSYSLGANNIANVMGVFVPVFPFKPLDLYIFHVTGTEQLFILGGIAIGVGVFTYSGRVMSTVGKGIIKLRPETALIVVFSSALVLLLFSSESLEYFLALYGLPTIPLVPVSSSQAIVGGIIGIGLAHGGRGINLRMVGRIASGWVTTPILAGVISFVTLFFIQNVFQQKVFDPSNYLLDDEVIARAASEGIIYGGLESLKGSEFTRESQFHEELKRVHPEMPRDQAVRIIYLSESASILVNTSLVKNEVDSGWISSGQAAALNLFDRNEYKRGWQFYDALEKSSPEWKKRPDSKINKIYNRAIDRKRNYLIKIFRKNGHR